MRGVGQEAPRPRQSARRDVPRERQLGEHGTRRLLPQGREPVRPAGRGRQRVGVGQRLEGAVHHGRRPIPKGPEVGTGEGPPRRRVERLRSRLGPPVGRFALDPKLRSHGIGMRCAQTLSEPQLASGGSRHRGSSCFASFTHFETGTTTSSLPCRRSAPSAATGTRRLVLRPGQPEVPFRRREDQGHAVVNCANWTFRARGEHGRALDPPLRAFQESQSPAIAKALPLPRRCARNGARPFPSPFHSAAIDHDEAAMTPESIAKCRGSSDRSDRAWTHFGAHPLRLLGLRPPRDEAPADEMELARRRGPFVPEEGCVGARLNRGGPMSIGWTSKISAIESTGVVSVARPHIRPDLAPRAG